MKRMQFQKALKVPVKIISYRPRFLAETLIERLILLLLVVSTFFFPNVFAQNYTHWDLPEGAKARLGKGSAGGLKFSADGNRLMVRNSVGIWVYDAHSGVELDLLTDNLSDYLAMSPDGGTVASWGRDDKVYLWNVADSENKVTLSSDTSKVRRMTFSPDGRIVAGGTTDEKVILWDATSGAHKATLIGHTRMITAIVFSPDGKTLASGSWDETLRLWDVATGTHKTTLIKHTEGISNIAFSPDGRTFVSSSFNEDKVVLWDVGTWQQKAVLGTDINCFALSPDSSTLATGNWKGELHLWDVASGIHKAEFLGHPSGIFSVAFSPDGKTLASGGEDKLYLWDIASDTRKLSITGHTTGVISIAFSPDGGTLASGSSEQILLWDTATSTHEATLFVGDWATNAGFGQPGMENSADINGDGTVDIADLLMVAGALAADNGAPSTHSRSIESLTGAEVEQWLRQAQHVSDKAPIFQKGIVVLQNLLTVLIPKETVLLPNYPNPFNPETWIPYQLAETADVTIRIYATSGALVRTLVLGSRPAGIYQSRDQAAYWNGKNALGESVASGIYFYTLSAGRFTATRRMVIQK